MAGQTKPWRAAEREEQPSRRAGRRQWHGACSLSAAMLPMALSQRYLSWLAAISGGERLMMDGVSVVDECVITGSG